VLKLNDKPRQHTHQDTRKRRGRNVAKSPTPTNPKLWSRAKAEAKKKFKVYPSAYANAWAAKWYKSKGGGWRGKDNRVKKA
jgi:hypothetical protein